MVFTIINDQVRVYSYVWNICARCYLAYNRPKYTYCYYCQTLNCIWINPIISYIIIRYQEHTHQQYIIQQTTFCAALNSEMFQFCLGLDVTPSQNVANDREHKLHPKGLFSIHKYESLYQLSEEKSKPISNSIEYDPLAL